VSLGDPYTGIGISYDGCQIGHVTALQLDFMPTVTPSSCDQLLEVVADPGEVSGQIIALDCNGQERWATGGRFSFYEPCDHCPHNPVEPGTWGKVKALYR
jgi:hypothetical protein